MIIRMFTALQDFDSTELRSSYAKGLTYNMVSNNKKLEDLAEVWSLEGKIQFVPMDGTRATLSGTGVVESNFWVMTKAAWRSLWR